MVLGSFFHSRSESLLFDGCRFAFLMNAILIPHVNVWQEVLIEILLQ